MTSWKVPFNRVEPIGQEQEYVREAIARGHISGSGTFTRRCEEWLERTLGARRVLLTTSGTHALELAALLINVGPADEVIVPSFTFVSTVNAFILRGARPRFVDIRDDTLNLDERLVPEALGPATRALCVVHYGGVACEMDALGALAARANISVIEDAAHALFGRYRGRPLGSIGRVAALSFHETKNITCGEGGALVINDPSLVERAEMMREKGTDRSRFLRGEVDKYTWREPGSSWIPSEMLAAFLFGQLEVHDNIQCRRQAVYARYLAGLSGWAEREAVRLPTVPSHCEAPAHVFYLRLRSRADRDRLLAHLRADGILATSHYEALHSSPFGVAHGYDNPRLPVTDRVSAQLVRLPLFPSLSEVQQQAVIDGVLRFTSSAGSQAPEAAV